MSFAITKECQVAHLQPEVAPFQRYRMLAVQHRECAQKELLPNARRVLEASAECWEILAERHEAAARCAAEVPVTSSAVAQSPSPRGPEPARVGKLVFDLARRIVWANGARIRLTDQEYAILDCLRLKQGATASKETLLDYLYPRNDQPDSQIVNVLVCKLRKKLAGVCDGERCIETVRTAGYRLTVTEA